MKKKILISIIAGAVLLGALAFAGCGEGAENHTHSWGEWQVSKEATCKEEGEELRVCQDDKTHTETRSIPMTITEHTYVAGFCSVCGTFDSTYYTEGLNFELINDGTEYKVTNYYGTDIDVYIPVTYNDIPVTSIKSASRSSDGVFYNKKITSVTIGANVNTIGDYAFYGCSSLTSVTIDNNVTSIDSYAFNGCSSLTSIEIPDSVTSIGEGAFGGCSSLTSITIPDSVTSIGKSAFGGCSSLMSVTIGNSVTSIGDYAFGVCSSLMSVTIGNSVKSIGYYAFNNCSGLTSIEIPESVTNIGSYAFQKCSNLTAVYVSDVAKWCNISFGSYEANPLYYAHNLYINKKSVTDLVVPDSVTSIGKNVFAGYSSLTSVTIPNSVTSIGEYAFYSCRNLSSVTFGNCLTSIGHHAFSICSGLTSVVLPDSITSIGYATFEYCENMQYNEYDNAYYLGTTNNPYFLLVKAINTSISSCAIHQDTKCIGGYAFDKCSNLTSIVIPDSVTSIGSDAFAACSNLTSVTIGNGVTSIGSDAFRESFRLNAVNITEVTVWCNISFDSGTSNPLYNAHNLYLNGKLVTDLAIPDGVTSIGDKAFSNCSSLTSVTIGNSVTSIGDYAFNYCNGLTSVTIGNNVKSIGSFAFYSCESLTSVTIGNSVTSIGDYAFSDCSGLTSVTIGNNVKNIGEYAFYRCYSLTSIEISDSVKSIGDKAFSNCSKLTSVVIPESVTNIGDYAFDNCSKLTSVTIGNGVTSIGSSAFSSCNRLTAVYISDIAKWCNISFDDSSSNPLTYAHNLYLNGELVTDLVIPDGVTSIGSSAFRGCSGLTSIVIPDSVTTIGVCAFYNCSSLTDITYKGSEEEWDSISKGKNWNNNTGNYTIYCTNGHEHEWGDWKVTTPAGCTTPGEETRICKIDPSHTETRSIAAKGHIRNSHKGKQATCYEKGWYDYETCSRCDYSTYQEIPMTSHNFGEWQAATGDVGYKWYRRCKNSGCDFVDVSGVEGPNI